jgi:hypothetical protein
MIVKSGGAPYKTFWENRETGATPVRTRRCVRGRNPQVATGTLTNGPGRCGQ